jgi:FtsP/CotA-like multicopper oxidase with cupredoxin domain
MAEYSENPRREGLTSKAKIQKADKPAAIERREFIKLGATGVVASLAGCAAPSVLSPGPDGAGANALPEDAAGAQMPSDEALNIPEIGDLADPETMFSEDWQEPWTWRPEQWPDDQLALNVVRNQNPGISSSPGNPLSSIFSYNGISPGPTIRVRNDGEVRIRLRNTLPLNEYLTPFGPAPDPLDVVPAKRAAICALTGDPPLLSNPEDPTSCPVFIFPEAWHEVLGFAVRPGWTLNQHMNGIHCAHTTNIHYHGLHVFPQKNEDGSHSDNVTLRIIPRDDYDARMASNDPSLHELAEHEHVAQLDYRLQLSFQRNGERLPHPPGTHWYHPHAHGSTNDQVASGMAGYLIVEGDVDEAINEAMTGEKHPDPTSKTGPYDYRERLVFIQRVFVGSLDLDAGPKKQNLRFPPPPQSGAAPPRVMKMRPGAVERWRVLNGSVDGSGTKRFMVLEGQYVQRNNRMWRVVVGTGGEDDQRTRRLEPVSEQDFENAKLDLHQLSFDGITLVREENGGAAHFIRDLSKQNAGTENPFAAPAMPGENEYQARLRALESVFKDGDSLRRSWVRPNEVYLTNANRTDVLFKAPLDSNGKVFTIFAKEAHIQTDNFQRFLQNRVADPKANARRELFDVVLAYIHVTGPSVEGGDFDIQSLAEHLPPVPPLLAPVQEEELRVPAAEARKTGVAAGSLRTRSISYSGTGGADFPIIEVPDEFVAGHPELKGLVWDTHEGVNVLLANWTRTMGINTEFDLLHNPKPQAARKFAPHDPMRSRVLVNTAEEWALFNCSQMLWCQSDRERYPQPGSYRSHFRSYPISRAEGQRRYARDPKFMISGKGNDHPFHIHINPMWVLRIDVPDENGDLHNVLPEPMWMDTVAIPRNGGRVVFRTRFDDFTGHWVNHCHVLAHEDVGMMQLMECTDDETRVNYRPRTRTARHGMSGGEVDAIYPKPSLELMYRQNLSFVDPNEMGYQEYPGFELEIPVPGPEGA